MPTRTVTIDLNEITGAAFGPTNVVFRAKPGQTADGSAIPATPKSAEIAADGTGSITLTTGVATLVTLPDGYVGEIVVPPGSGSVSLASLLAAPGVATDTVLAEIESQIGTHAGTNLHVPAGGTTGQVLAKTSNTDRAVAWTTVGGVSTADARKLALIPTVTPPPTTGWEWVNHSDATATPDGESLLLAIPGRSSGSTSNYSPSFYCREYDPTKTYTIGTLLPGRYTADSTIVGIALYSTTSDFCPFFAPCSTGTTAYLPRLGRARFNSLTSAPSAIGTPTAEPWENDFSTLYVRFLPESGGSITVQYSNNGKIWNTFTNTEDHATNAFDRIGVILMTRGTSVQAARAASACLFSWAVA